MNNENITPDSPVTETVEEVNTTVTETTVSDNNIESQSFTIEDFNKIETTQGTVKLNEQIFLELKTTNLYLNLILIATVLCFLYYIISKALKRLFYINIF